MRQKSIQGLDRDTETSGRVALSRETYAAGSESLFRPIHYLGSKLRLAHPISSKVLECCPPDGRVLDLFSGSGTVAAFLANHRAVTSVDIQEYSRVICSALLSERSRDLDNFEDISEQCQHGLFYTELSKACRPLIEYETYAREEAVTGNFEPICEFLEQMPLIRVTSEAGQMRDAKLRHCAHEALARMNEVLKRFGTRTSVITYYYGGLYFSIEQAIALDSMADAASRSSNRVASDLLKASVLSTASALVNTVGKQFAQPLKPRTKTGKPKPSLLQTINRDRDSDPWKIFAHYLTTYLKYQPARAGHTVHRMDYLEAIGSEEIQFDVVYADPPYTRDHYSRFYHVLETIALRDIPEIATVKRHGTTRLSRGIYRHNRHQSDFCIRSKALGAFQNLFEGIARRRTPLILSYSPHENDDGSHPRVVTLSDLIALAERSFSNVDVEYATDFSHANLNHKDTHLQRRQHSEMLITCIP